MRTCDIRNACRSGQLTTLACIACLLFLLHRRSFSQLHLVSCPAACAVETLYLSQHLARWRISVERQHYALSILVYSPRDAEYLNRARHPVPKNCYLNLRHSMSPHDPTSAPGELLSASWTVQQLLLVPTVRAKILSHLCIICTIPDTPEFANMPMWEEDQRKLCS